MNYVIMKRFGEIDPARAFSKLTHARIVELPIPVIRDDRSRSVARQIKNHVQNVLASHYLGGQDDQEIELALRHLWGISPDEGRYINGFFSGLPDGQGVRDLFPDGAPVAVPLPSDKGSLAA